MPCAPAGRQARRANSGSVSQTTCDRTPMASPSRTHRHTSARREPRLATIGTARHAGRDARNNACATSASASPGMSLIGRRPVIQNSGAAASSTRPTAQRTRVSATVPCQRGSATRRATTASQRNGAADRERHGQRQCVGTNANRAPGISRCTRARPRRPAGDVDRISRRVRLILVEVVVVQREAEVDRVEILERRCQEGQCSSNADSSAASRQRASPANAGDRSGTVTVRATKGRTLSDGTKLETVIQAAPSVSLQDRP